MKRTSILMLTFLLILIGMPIEAIGQAVDTSVETATVSIKNSSRTDSITIAYDGFSEDVEASYGINFDIPKGKLVTITIKDGNAKPFPGAVKLKATNINGQETVLTNYHNQFYFKAGEEYKDYGVITEVTSWKEDDATYDILSVERFDDQYVEYGTTKEELDLPSRVNVTLDDEILFGPGPSVVEFPITWDDGTPNYQGTQNALFSGRIDGDVDHSTYNIELMVYVLFYDLEEIESFTNIEQPFSTVFTLPQEADVVLDQWYLDGSSKVFTGTSKTDTFEIQFYDAPGINTDYELRNEEIYHASPILPVHVFNPKNIEAIQKVSPLYLEIAEDLYLNTQTYLPGESEPTPPNVADAPLDNDSTFPLSIEWDMDNPQVSDPELGPREKVYTGQWILNEGINNPGDYKVFFTSSMNYLSIADDVDLGSHGFAYGGSEPNRPNPVSTPLTIGDNRYFLVDWTLTSSQMVEDEMVKSYVGAYNNLPDGIVNPNDYQAFFETKEKYLVIVDVINPPVLHIPQGTPYGDLELPETVQVEYDDGSFADLPVNWSQGSYDGILDVDLVGALVLPEGVLNSNDLSPLQGINIFTDRIVSADDPQPLVVAPGTLLSEIVPQEAMAYFTDEELDGYWSVDFGLDFAITSDIVLRGDFDSLPNHVGNPDDIHVNQVITVQKVIITDHEEAEVESSGLTLRIGYNRSVAEGQGQLYYQLLPYFELDQDDEVIWSIEEGSSYIDLSDGGFVQGLDGGQATVKITVKYGQENAYTLEDTIPINVIEYGPPTPPTPPTPQTADPFITLDRNYVELEYGTDALEEFFSYDFTETIFNSNDSRVEWIIDDEAIASVDENGLVEAVSAGETRVTVRHIASGATASATVVVFLVGEEENPLGAVDFFEPYIIGYPDQTFGPQRPVTRAEVATMFARILKLNLDFPGAPKYKDVSESTWYYQYVQAATRAGLFGGYGDGNFRPDAPMTRGEIATVFSKYWDFLNIRVNPLPTDALADVDGSHWASSYIYKMFNAGIVKGFEDGSFRPDTNTLREQVVGMINTLINRPEFFPENTKYVDITKDHWAFGNIEAATTPYSARGNLQTIDEEN